MEEINELYDSIKDLEICLSEYHILKSQIKNIESEIKLLESQMNKHNKDNILNKINTLERQYQDILLEIKKIDLSTKECFKLSEISAMFEFINDEAVLIEKSLNFLNSLIYDIYCSREQIWKYFGNIRNLRDGTFKIIKINMEIEEFFEILRKLENILFYERCFLRIQDIIENELSCVLVDEIMLYKDNSHVYIIFWYNEDIIEEDMYFKDLYKANIEILKNIKFIGDIFHKVFKDNLKERLLENTLSRNNMYILHENEVYNHTDDKTLEDKCLNEVILQNDIDSRIRELNEFLKSSEFFITNIEEWKLDCVMKKVICLSKAEKSNEIRRLINVEDVSMPKYVSKELYEFVQAYKIYQGINSSRKEKALKIIERALNKICKSDDLFVMFADMTVSRKFFRNISVNKDTLFSDIINESTTITRCLLDSPLLIKVYLKEKTVNFTENIQKFVPSRSQEIFMISFFNILYENLASSLLSIRTLTNEKIRDISDILKYALELSFNIPKSEVSTYDKLNSIYLIFTSNKDEIRELYKKDKLQLSKEEIDSLYSLVFKRRL